MEVLSRKEKGRAILAISHVSLPASPVTPEMCACRASPPETQLTMPMESGFPGKTPSPTWLRTLALLGLVLLPVVWIWSLLLPGFLRLADVGAREGAAPHQVLRALLPPTPTSGSGIAPCAVTRSPWTHRSTSLSG